MVVLELKPGDVDLDVLTQAQRDGEAGLYAAAMAGFVRHLAADYEGRCRALKARTVELRDQIIGTASHGRTADALSHVQAGFEAWMRFAVEVGAITAVEADRRVGECWQALCELVHDQADAQADADPVARFRRLIIAAIASGGAHITGSDGGQPPMPARWGWRTDRPHNPLGFTALGDKIGWLDGDGVWLQPEAAYAAANAQGRALDEALAMQPQTLFTRMREAGVLASFEQESATGKVRNTVQKSHCGQRGRWLRLPLGFFSEQEPAETAEILAFPNAEARRDYEQGLRLIEG
jgi:hypothetical protein